MNASIVSPAEARQEASDIKTHLINEDFPLAAVDYLPSSLSIVPQEQRKNWISGDVSGCQGVRKLAADRKC